MTVSRSVASRRNLLKTASWTVPSAAVAVTAPALAASTGGDSTTPPGSGGGGTPTNPTDPTDPTSPACGAVTHTFGATIDLDTPDYSNANYTGSLKSPDDPVNGKLQHYVIDGSRVYWRPVLGFLDGAEPGAKLTIPIDPTWSEPRVDNYLGNALYARFDGPNASLMTSDLAQPAVTITDTEITFVWNEAIAPGAAGGIVISALPLGGSEAVHAGDPYFGQATLTFTPASC
ncbi:hypothetical protein JSY14_07625 [Brachybacterium sp. EF45031]|uniref:hypothetical protein n=1 Tax=Brachybacterium sillae TaxID=2810536 RepID=UPI00217DB9B9|nr:hypothetical protein [Brachybacterium sillae]MCS6711892.1 hypothetical protein [Brachybacterium sillae]